MTLVSSVFATLLATVVAISGAEQRGEPKPRIFPGTTSKHDDVPLVRLTRDILSPTKYDKRVRPVVDHEQSLKINVSMSLYQIVDVNEPAQNIKLNVWMIQKWVDEALDWNPDEYNGINTTILPHDVLWLPDTVVYNSVVMNPDETERYMNIRADSLHHQGRRGSQMSFLYPALYTVTCRLNIRYFPYDQQNCTLTISSWTNSKSALDYYADPHVNLASYITNEEWEVISFKIYRHEYKYACCAEPWVILEASIVIRRKPLYYVINLILPTSIITIVAITGFFTPASTSDDRTEKINLGITTLLAMSILMLMVSDQMPTTSEFVPLIAWFYLAIIIIISIGTFLTSVILSIQGRRQYGKMPPLTIRYLFFHKWIMFVWMRAPPQLQLLWDELDDHPQTAYLRFCEEKDALKKKKKKRIPSENGKEVFAAESESMRAPSGTVTPTTAVPMPVIAEPVPTPPSAPLPGTAARSNWLKVGKAAIRTKSTDGANLPMIDLGSMPPSPSASGHHSARSSIWENAISIVATPSKRPSADGTHSAKRPTAPGGEVNVMKSRRQCSLEWELLATILDRILLVVFIGSVVIVTAGIMCTGYAAQMHYDAVARELISA
uniref:Acetylcholine receptor subunit alpha-type deg-3 n=1 Tax=Panagrellus redivivus TaxID=6233 RepID=A0A7E4VY85_PANRE